MSSRTGHSVAADLAAQRPQLIRERLALSCDPYDAVLALRGDRRPVALVGAWLGGGAILASEPLVVAEPHDDPFALLASQPEVNDAHGAWLASEAADDDDLGAGIGGGWLGALGYDLARRIEPVPPVPPRPCPRPPFSLGYYDHLLRQDAEGWWWFEALWNASRDHALRERRRQLLARLSDAAEIQPFHVGSFAACAPGFHGHRAAIEECRERIHAGEIFQANLCLRLEARWSGDPLDLFAVAGRRLRPEYAALVVDEDGAIVSMSPELFLRRRDRVVISEPIKGTAARVGSSGPEALSVSSKDRSENVMIVDLMRNDLGRVAAYGSVGVDQLAQPRPHPGVWHLVSTVSATLRDDVDDEQLVRAAFPPGSVTGAPKVQALRVINELEATAREAYTGAIGLATPTAGLELNVAIRTFEIRDETIWLGVGGGIVADSEPDAELAECLHKARPIVAAAGSCIVDDAIAAGRGGRWRSGLRPPSGRGGRSSLPWALAIARAERPDPRQGIFTTALVGPGAALGLSAHLDRLSASARELYGCEPERGWRTRALSLAATANAPARLRIDVVPQSNGTLAATLSLGPVPARPDAPLRPVVLPGGLGVHKWRDRRLLDELAAMLKGVPLLLDADGCVLEAGHTAVLLEEGDGLIAPPLDRALLPSLGLRALLEGGATVRHEAFGLERVREADGIVLVSALRVVRGARLGGRGG